MPAYYYPISVKAGTGASLRFDTDATSGVQVPVYDAIGDLIPGSIVRADTDTGAVPTVFGDAATVYVRQVDYRGTVGALVATVAGVTTSPPQPGGSASGAAIGNVVTATSAAQIAAINSAGLAGVSAPGTPLVALKGDNSTNDQPAFSALLNYLSAVYVATGIAQVIYCPAGIYQMRDNGTIWKTGVGVVGDGPNRTIFRQSNPVNTTNPVPFGTFTVALNSASVTNYLADCWFSGFTIDGSGVSLGSYNVGAKAFALQFLLRCTFKDIILQNCGASGLGIDYLSDTLVENVRCYNNGRLNDGTQLGGGGIGIGVGGWAAGGSSIVEGADVIGCVAQGNGTHGLFFELQNSAWAKPKGYRVLGGRYTGNRYGVSDWGCDGLKVIGATLNGNLQHGFNVSGASAVSQTAGVGGLLTGCEITGNALDGVCIGDALAGNYAITGNQINANGRDGIHYLNVSNSASTGLAAMMLSCNDVTGNGRCGLRVDALLNNPIINGGKWRNNCTANGATVTSTNSVYGPLTITDSGQTWVVNAYKGQVVTVGAQTAVVASNTATALTLWPAKANGTTAWTTGTPANGTSYTLAGAASDRGGWTFTQTVNHPVIKANRVWDDNGTRIQPYSWVITSGGACNSGQVSDNDFTASLNGSFSFAVNPSGGNYVNNAGLAVGTLGSPGVTVIDGPLSFAPTTTTTAPGAGAAGALPATPAGYMTVTVNGAARQIPYY